MPVLNGDSNDPLIAGVTGVHTFGGAGVEGSCLSRQRVPPGTPVPTNSSTRRDCGVFGKSVPGPGVLGAHDPEGFPIIPGFVFGPYGVSGFSSDPRGSGVFGFGRLGSGPGVLGAQTGNQPGVFGHNAVPTPRIGAPGVLGSASTNSTENGAGVLGENYGGGYGVVGLTYGLPGTFRAAALFRNRGVGNGVEGHANKNENGWGGYFSGQPRDDITLANAGALLCDGLVEIRNGFIRQSLQHSDGSQRLLYNPLSPDSTCEDFGRGDLVDGRASVELDSDFAAVLRIEDEEYHVFLTPEGNSNGLYVSSRSAAGFEVREQQGGESSLTFSYRVVAKRKDGEMERFAHVETPEEMLQEDQEESPVEPPLSVDSLSEFIAAEEEPETPQEDPFSAQTQQREQRQAQSPAAPGTDHASLGELQRQMELLSQQIEELRRRTEGQEEPPEPGE